MDSEQQRLMLGILTSNRELMARCNTILKSGYFNDELKKGADFIKKYFEKHKNVPPIEVVRSQTGVVLETIPADKALFDFTSNALETFCKNKAVEAAILSGPELLNKGDFGKIIEVMKEAVSTSLESDIGTAFFGNIRSNLEHALVSEQLLSTGWPELDEALGGGIGRQEMILFAANSGGGKSVTMLNLGRQLLTQGHNGVYISLEMRQDIVTKRLASMMAGVKAENLLKEMDGVVDRIEMAAGSSGELYIKRMPENRTNASTIHAFITQLEREKGFKPDFIIIDYLDICGSITPVGADNMFVKDKFVAEELRALGLDYDCSIITASQLGRTALEVDQVLQSHIQGGISKINTADYVIAIRQTDGEKASGEIWFQILKSRNSSGVGRKIMLRWDSNTLAITSNKNRSGPANGGLTLRTKGSTLKSKISDLIPDDE